MGVEASRPRGSHRPSPPQPSSPRTGNGQLKFCTPPHSGTGVYDSAFSSITHVCVQYSTSASSPVTAMGPTVPFPLVATTVSLGVLSAVAGKVSHGPYRMYVVRLCPGVKELKLPPSVLPLL